MRIAIADDEKRYSNQLQEQLRRFGLENQIEMQLFPFQNGAELLESFRGSWDMVLLDVDMPIMNGMEVARAIRKLDPEILIMFIYNKVSLWVTWKWVTWKWVTRHGWSLGSCRPWVQGRVKGWFRSMQSPADGLASPGKLAPWGLRRSYALRGMGMRSGAGKRWRA